MEVLWSGGRGSSVDAAELRSVTSGGEEPSRGVMGGSWVQMCRLRSRQACRVVERVQEDWILLLTHRAALLPIARVISHRWPSDLHLWPWHGRAVVRCAHAPWWGGLWRLWDARMV